MQTSTSLQHVPHDVRLETGNTISERLGNKVSFATQKLDELFSLADFFSKDVENFTVGNPAVRKVQEAIFETDLITRAETYDQRRKKQYRYPSFPTTSIGSFPQTPEIRKMRLQYKKGQISEIRYREAVASEIGYSIGIQEAIGMDVLVHGEAERTDMVRTIYFDLHQDERYLLKCSLRKSINAG